ncbi:Autophagy protein 22 [Entophlyctis sp. JEL0112]|nr:Autophagy protein 22 [Entophlyctis sp. JEL0112]
MAETTTPGDDKAVAIADAADAAAEFTDIDATPVASSELRAWYVFGSFTDSVSFCFAFFVSLIVESLGASAAFESSDHTVPCNTTVTGYSCVIPINGAWIDPSSFYFYCVTFGTFLQLLLFVGMGAIADHGNWRKKFMLGFSAVGAVACVLFAAVTDKEGYMFGGILAIIGMVCLGATYVFIYAFLPPLARNHPDFQAVSSDPSSTKHDLLAKLDFVTNKISSTAFVWMYSGTVVALIIAVALDLFIKVPDSLPTDYAFQLATAVISVGWLIGCGIVYKYMRDRPGPPLPPGDNVVFFSFKKVFKSFGKAGKLSNLFTFLLGWFFYSDSFGTLVNVSVLWAQTQLGFSTTEILILAAEVQLTALIGAYGWNQIQTRTKIASKNVVVIQNCIYILIPAWGLLGFVPSISLGYKHKIELFLAAGLHGLLLGGTQSNCRSLFSQLLPAGEESQFFSLYEITDKGSSWVGPLVVAAIDDSGANRSFVFLFLTLQFIVSLAIFSRVDVVGGIEQGKVFGAVDRELEAAAKQA